MKARNLFLALSILVSCLACEQVIPIDLPPHTPLLVINSTFSPDSVWSASLTASQSITVAGTPKPVTNGSITVWENGNLVDSLTHLYDDIYRSTTAQQPIVGHNYTLKASAAGYTDVTGSDYAPVSVMPIDLAWRDSVSLDNYGSWKGEISFSINDPANVRNYYLLAVYVFDPLGGTYPLELMVPDPIVSHDVFGGQVNFDDATFDGTKRQFKLQVDNDTHANAQLILGLSTVSESYYRYMVTLSSNTTSGFDPFAEPVRIYSNMTAGMGIFAGFSTQFVAVPF